ncbi:hypothetical protein [Aureispira sp. CCB-QB1]|uniref:hypothetical protein n=1 Tax=Aureispira sp. CCB-QB1 TaxID=1313421 RepID=UPI0006971B13|nr:hypothetical protein [Aureispira sp. CCB-QB1]
MSCGCNTGYQDVGIEGMDEADMMLMGGAVGGYVATAYIDNMLVYEKDGTKKTGAIAENDTMRNGGYALAGVALNWFMPDEPLAKGAGIGMAIYGVKELIRGQYPTAGIKGIRRNGNPQYLAGNQQRNGSPKYIGRADSSRMNLGLSNNSQNAQKQKTSKVRVEY